MRRFGLAGLGARIKAVVLVCGAVGMFAICGALAARGANAESTPWVDFHLGLASGSPSTGTSASLYILYKAPGDPNAKPSALRRVVIAAPEGARYDGGAVPACTASDQELMLLGRNACPASSQVGGGTVTAITGFGAPIDPVTLDATFFNEGTGVIQLLTQHGTNVAMAVLHGKFTAPNTITFDSVPSVPGGPPDFATAVREVNVSLTNAGSPSRPFLSTPPACPASREWISWLSYSTADGHTYSAQSATPCAASERAAPTHARARRRRLTVSPKSAPAHSIVRYRFALVSTARRCVSGASIGLLDRAVRTNRRGRATLTLRTGNPGSYRATASKRGCPTTRTRIDITPTQDPPPRSHRSDPTSFSGSCQFSGTVSFHPALTAAPRQGQVSAVATGPCTGTLTQPDGHSQSLNNQTVEAVATSQGLESCAAGRGSGAGYLNFGARRLHFTYTELRTGPALVLHASGTRGGSAVAQANVSPSANPIAVLQACGASGLEQAPIDIRLATTPTITG